MDPVDPKLKKAAAEIQEILKAHNIAGMVLLSSGERAEFINHIFAHDGPSWSCLYAEKDGVRIRAKGRRDHAERYRINMTVKMVHTVRDLLAMQFGAFDGICEMVAKHLHIEEGERAFKPGK